MRLGSILVLFVGLVMLGSGFGLSSPNNHISPSLDDNQNNSEFLSQMDAVFTAIPQAAAHVPINVNVSLNSDHEQRTMVKVQWTHIASNACGAGCTTDEVISGQSADVDVVRILNGSSNTGGTNIVNNDTFTKSGGAGGVYVDTGLEQGSLYTYIVCHPDPDESLCVNNENFAQSASQVSITTHANTTNVAFTNIGKSSVKMDWSNSNGFNHTGITKWVIEYRLANSTENRVTADTGFSTSTISNSTGTIGGSGTQSTCEHCSLLTSHTLEGLQSGKTYDIRVTPYVGGVYGVSETASHASQIYTVSIANQKANTPQAPLVLDFDASGLTGSTTNVKATLFEDKGADRILQSVLYLNVAGSDTADVSDTYVTWNYFDGVTVVDPSGYLRDATVMTTETGVRTFDVDYQLTYAKKPAKSALIIEATDFTQRTGTATIGGAISSGLNLEVEKQENPTLWAPGVIDQEVPKLLLADVEFFISEQIIDVSKDTITENVPDTIFDKLVATENVMKMGYDDVKTIVISGKILDEFYHMKVPISFTISNNDGFKMVVTALTTSDKLFEVPVIATQFEPGLYNIDAQYVNYVSESITFEVLE